MSPQTAGAMGELVMARDATINEQSALLGLTILSGSRIKTMEKGAAGVNLGRQGRLECGPRTDLVLRLSAGAVDGEMTSGRLAVSLRAGVKLSIKFGAATVRTDGGPATNLTIEAAAEKLSVRTKSGTAVVAVGGESDRVDAGQEMTMNLGRNAPPARESRRMMKSAPGGATRSVFPGIGWGFGLTELVCAGIEASIVRNTWNQPASGLHPVRTITCRDADNDYCKPRGHVRP